MMAVRLADFADDDGKGVYPGVARLSRETELSERTVQRILADFVAEGLLLVVKEASGRPGQTTRYDFDMAAIDRLSAAKNSLSTGDTMSPVAGEGVTPTTETGDTDDRDGCHHVTRTVIEPLPEPLPEREAREREPSEEENPKKIEEAFWRTIKDWPKFAGMPKTNAKREWFALTTEERRAAEAGRDPWRAMLDAQKKSHVPAPSTYFREKLWKDLPASRPEAERPKMFTPFSRGWMGRHFHGLLRPRRQLVFTALEDSMIAADPAKEAMLWADKCRKHGWPEVVQLHAAALEFRGVAVPGALADAAAGFMAVKVGGEVWEAWKRLHDARHWPFVPRPHKLEFVQFPPIDPDDEDLDHAVETALVAFEAELRARGRTDDAA